MLIVLTDMIANITKADYRKLISSLDFSSLICPCCHCTGMYEFAHYPRLIKNPKYHGKVLLTITRVRCLNEQCRATHAILPSSMIPNSQIPMADMIRIIEAQSSEDVKKISDENIHISPENIRLAKIRFKKFWKSRIENMRNTVGSEAFLSECISIFQMCFMQTRMIKCFILQ